MGLFSKIVNVFYDDVEEEEVVEEKPKKEELIKKVEKPRIEEVHIPKVDIAKDDKSFSEREIFSTNNSSIKTEAKTFKFPMIDEEEDLPIKPRRSGISFEEDRPKPSKREIKFDKIEKSNVEEKKETVRTFKPSPVISPVYGILDENYTKEDMIARQEKQKTYHVDNDKNYDTVRRKAYGTLEDELEDTLTRISKQDEELSKTMEEVNKFDREENNKNIEDLLNEIEIDKNMSIGEIEEKMKDRIEEEETLKEDKKTEELENTSFDKTLEHDLFNLIDSMYEERDGK